MTNGRRQWRYIGDWRADLVGVLVLFCYDSFIRTPLYNGVGTAMIVSLMLEPMAYLTVLALRYVFQWLELDIRRSPGSITLVAMLAFAGGALQASVARLTTLATGLAVARWNAVEAWILPFSYYTFIILSWSLSHLWSAAQMKAAEAQRRAAIAETDALRAELQHLRHQLDPHFLFNALNGIAAEITPHPHQATGMVHELADYLRYSLDHRDLALAPLSTELDAIRAYLEVQKVRFAGRLDYAIDAHPTARPLLTPGFLLQPLVENAIKHGMKSGVALVVNVSATLSDAQLRLRVTNPGVLRADWRIAGAPGVGLSVLSRRLELHYPGEQHFTLSQQGGAVVAEIALAGSPKLT